MSTIFRGNLTTNRCGQKKKAAQRAAFSISGIGKSALAELGRAAGGRSVAKSAELRFRRPAEAASAPLLLRSPRNPLRWASAGARE